MPGRMEPQNVSSAWGSAGARFRALGVSGADVLDPFRPERRQHLLGERAERFPVVRALAERDVEPMTAEITVSTDQVHDVSRRAPEEPGALLTAVAPAAEVTLVDLLAARRARRVGPEIKAEIRCADDGRRISFLGLAPARQDVALLLPFLRTDVRAVPA